VERHDRHSTGGCGEKGGNGAMGKTTKKDLRRINLTPLREMARMFLELAMEVHVDSGHLSNFSLCVSTWCLVNRELANRVLREIAQEHARQHPARKLKRGKK
jgi:hypothetical protein